MAPLASKVGTMAGVMARSFGAFFIKGVSAAIQASIAAQGVNDPNGEVLGLLGEEGDLDVTDRHFCRRKKRSESIHSIKHPQKGDLMDSSLTKRETTYRLRDL